MNFTPSEQVIYALRPGDVLISEGAGSLTAVGTSAVWQGEIEGTVCFQNTLLRARPRQGVEPRFLAWWCRHAYASGMFASVAGGANIFHLGAERIRALPATMPAQAQQKEIADFLDAETTRIDALIGKKVDLVRLLDERISRLLNDLIGLDHIVGSDGVPTGLSGRRSVRLGSLATVQTGLTLDAQRLVTQSAVTMPYVRVANVQDGRLDLADVKEVTVPLPLAARSRLRRGDVLMTEGGDQDKLGRGAVWPAEIEPCLHQNHIFAVRPNSAVLLPEYLALVTRTSYARRYFEVTASKTTGIASTNTAKITAFRVPLPPLADQQDIINRHRQATEASDGLRERLAAQLTLLQEHRQALITAAVTGELEVA